MKFFFLKHFNLAQIYMFNKAYLTQNTSNLTAVISFLTSVIDFEHIVKSTIETDFKNNFPHIILTATGIDKP